MTRSQMIRRAAALPKGNHERRALLERLSADKSAGGRDFPSMSPFKLPGVQLLKDVQSAGSHSKDDIAKFDFERVLWNPVEANASDRSGRLMMQWYAYPHGDFMNKTTGNRGNYIYGYVTVYLDVSKDIGGVLVVKVENTVKSY